MPGVDGASTSGFRHAFSIGPYRRLWAARTVSQWGDVFNFVVLAPLIYHLTGSGVGVTGVVVAEILPVLAALTGRGAWTDSDVQGGSVDELLGVAVERAALEQLEVEVGGILEDRV
jgi:hypothetical protein